MKTQQRIPITTIKAKANQSHVSDEADEDARWEAAAIKVGLSACLAGHEVRYNGGHTYSKLCGKKFKPHFQFQTFCPEVAAGFGTPRATLRLIGTPDKPTLSWSNDAYDETNDTLTQKLNNGFKDKLTQFSELDGYILMKNSPSCGLERVKVYQENGYPHQERTSGIFASALKQAFPLLPIEEEGRLQDAALRENFILRVYAHHYFRKEVLDNPSVHNLLKFHSRYKYVLMAHHQQNYRILGRMLANTSYQDLSILIDDYFALFMKTIAKPANRKNHTNTLMHILGYLKRDVAPQARRAIADIILKYRQGQIPLITPLTLLKHYIDQNGNAYIKAQRYLEPYPESLGLRNSL